MNKYKFLIVEDEQEVVNDVIMFLNEYPDFIRSVTAANSIAEAGKLLRAERFDISILDIKLEDGLSYELINAFDRSKFGIIAFMTNLHEVERTVLRKCQPVLSIEKRVTRPEIANFIGILTQLQLVTSESYPLSATGKKEIALFLADNIYAFETGTSRSLPYRLCHYRDPISSIIKTIPVFEEIKDFVTLMNPFFFLQIHRSKIINLKRLVRILTGDKELLFDNGFKIGYPVDKYELILSRWAEVQGLNRISTQ